MNLWQTILDYHAVTHIVDFTPGSAGLAVAAAGVAEYDGIAANEAHKDWLESIADMCVMYKAGHEAGYAEHFSADKDFCEKAAKYFSGPMWRRADCSSLSSTTSRETKTTATSTATARSWSERQVFLSCASGDASTS